MSFIKLLNIKEKKKNCGLGDEEILTFFSEPLNQLSFKESRSMGYLLNKLGEQIDSRIAYPFFFSHKTYLDLIKKAEAYKDCVFFLTPVNVKQSTIISNYQSILKKIVQILIMFWIP